MARSSGRGLLLFCLSSVLLSVALAEFLVEKGTLKYYDKENKAWKSMTMALANFGKPLYGANTHGQLVYPATQRSTPKQCMAEDGSAIGCEFGCVDFSKAVPPMTVSGMPLHGINDREHIGMGAILLLDRGPQNSGHACKFTLKAWHAQLVNAKAVVIANYENHLTTMDKSDDDYTETYIKNLTIPAGFITNQDADILKGLLAKKDGQYHVFEDLILDVSLSWEDILPRQAKVNWEFWTNSNDACGSSCEAQKQFIKEFRPVAKELYTQDVATFQPHYLIWVCPPQYQDTEQCTKQCIFNGRYCCPDPEGDMDKGYDGKDVILENLRQLCVFSMANATGKPWIWWEYATKFGEQCKMSEQKYNRECAEDVFKSLGGEEWTGPDGSRGLEALYKCIGSPSENVENLMLEQEKNAQVGSDDVSEVSILPTVRVNGRQYRGALSVKEVTRALCSGFPKDREPPVCNNNAVTGAPDECLPGEAGYLECAANTNTGKTKCVNTFSSYYCDCGEGWTSRQSGNEAICLDLNECLYLNPADLGSDCTCERCACHNQKGGYRCEANIPNKCEQDTNNCWKGIVDGVHYSACVDEIEEYKEAAIRGTADSTTPTHECKCPPCFEGDGTTCKPKENFEFCNKRTGDPWVPLTENGQLDPAYVTSSGMSVGNIIIICVVVILFSTLTAYGVYRFQRRSHMDAEIRAIMAQYMPLDKENEENGQSRRSAAAISGATAHQRSPDRSGRMV